VTGIVMVTLMAVSFTLATRPFRKREEASRDKKKAAACACRGVPLAGFNAFWYSHHLLIVVYLLLLVHGWFMFLVDKWYQRTVRTRNYMYVYINISIYITTPKQQQQEQYSEGVTDVPVASAAD
jgi:respiratory burst oxidase